MNKFKKVIRQGESNGKDEEGLQWYGWIYHIKGLKALYKVRAQSCLYCLYILLKGLRLFGFELVEFGRK